MRMLSLLCLAFAVSAADVTVLAGATGTGRLLTGAVLDATSAPQPILIDVNEILQPSGEKVAVQLRCIGEATPRMNDQRVLITIQKATVSAQDRAETISLKAWIVDSLKGQPGVPATYHTNTEQIVTAQIVATTQQALAKADGTAVDQVAKDRADAYAKRIVDEIKPSLSVDNGLPVTVVFSDVVTFTVSQN